MTLALLKPEDAVKRLTRLVGGAPDAFEALADALRAEVHARGQAPRAVTLSRMARLLAPAVAVDAQRLGEVCQALEREGDLVAAPGGLLHATPTRVVPLTAQARVFSSLPTRPLAAALGREVAAAGAARTVAATVGLTGAVAEIGGVMVSPEAWAGLDRAPRADAAFLAQLDQRLQWEPIRAGALDSDGPLEWRTWQTTCDGAAWRRGHEGRLWWARSRFGGHHRAWTAGASPAASAFVTLGADDADRARFALSRDVAGAAVLRVKRDGAHAAIEIPGWLPRAEYRWLSLQAMPDVQGGGLRWAIAAADEEGIMQCLAERLGLTVEVS